MGIVVSGPIFRQGKHSGDHGVQPAMGIRRFELDGFCGTIGHARITPFAGMVPDGALIQKGNIFAWANLSADFTADTGVRGIKPLVIFMLDLQKRQQQFWVQPF